MFCQKCGRELSEGEVCNCTAETAASENAAGQQEETKTASALPDGQALMDSAKNAAEAIKNNPMVAEVMDTVKGVMINPVKQVSANAGRTDILWLILVVIESILTSFGITTIARRSFYQIMSKAAGEMSYGDYSKGMKVLGLTAPKIFGMEFIWSAASIFVAMIFAVILMAVCKKNGAFAPAANMTATAFLPSSIIMAAAGILSFIYAPIGIAVCFCAIISVILLGYVGIQKLDKFETSPFWIYLACVFLAYIVILLIQKLCVDTLMEEIIGELLDTIEYLL